MAIPKTFHLGSWRTLDGSSGNDDLRLPVNHLTTHGVIVGMTGSGKTGLVTVLVEEALRNGIPVLAIDVKGDLPNLLLTFPSFDPGLMAPWIDTGGTGDEGSVEEQARAMAEERRRSLALWGIGEPELQRYRQTTSLRVITPGATAGELLHVLSPLERRSERWDHDPESAQEALSAAVSLILRLLGRDGDPSKSRPHVLLSLLAARRLLRGGNADLGALLQDLLDPPIDHVGELPIDSYLGAGERHRLAADLNTLLASPTFASWRQGASLDVGEWLTPKDGRTPGVIVSVAHLDDEERGLVLGILLHEVLSWVRTLAGTKRLRALIVFDEVYGFLPPHPANPPTKKPLVSLMKQARGFGVGVVVATQNPMDLDYRALSNAGLWCIGRLQADADRVRVLDGLAGARGMKNAGGKDLANAVRRLAPRWFVVRDANAKQGVALMQPRWTMAMLRGPMTRREIRRARGKTDEEGP